MRPHRQQPTRLHHHWDSPGKNTGVGCHFLLQCRKVKSEVAQSCPTLSDPMDCSLPGFSVHGIFQARVLEWGAIAFSGIKGIACIKKEKNNIPPVYYWFHHCLRWWKISGLPHEYHISMVIIYLQASVLQKSEIKLFPLGTWQCM